MPRDFIEGKSDTMKSAAHALDRPKSPFPLHRIALCLCKLTARGLTRQTNNPIQNNLALTAFRHNIPLLQLSLYHTNSTTPERIPTRIPEAATTERREFRLQLCSAALTWNGPCDTTWRCSWRARWVWPWWVYKSFSTSWLSCHAPRATRSRWRCFDGRGSASWWRHHKEYRSWWTRCTQRCRW